MTFGQNLCNLNGMTSSPPPNPFAASILLFHAMFIPQMLQQVILPRENSVHFSALIVWTDMLLCANTMRSSLQMPLNILICAEGSLASSNWATD